MNRKPDQKTAATILANAFAAHGVKFGHQAALNLLATLEGFESFAHMKAAQKEAPKAVSPAPAFFPAHVLFGQDECEALDNALESEDKSALKSVLDSAKTFQYASEGQRAAFLDGVEEACGYLEYRIVNSLVEAVEGESTESASKNWEKNVLPALLEAHGQAYQDLVDKQFGS